jgi:hypothetical protein
MRSFFGKKNDSPKETAQNSPGQRRISASMSIINRGSINVYPSEQIINVAPDIKIEHDLATSKCRSDGDFIRHGATLSSEHAHKQRNKIILKKGKRRGRRLSLILNAMQLTDEQLASSAPELHKSDKIQPMLPEKVDLSIGSLDNIMVVEGWQMRHVSLLPETKVTTTEVRLHLLDGTTTVLKLSVTLTMENILKTLCLQHSYVYSEVTFEAGPRPPLLPVEMDSLLDTHIVKYAKMPDFWVAKKSKTYSTVSVLVNDELVLTYQVIDGAYLLIT